ncbi:hypothetical protein MKW98_027907 [Papaver atlanticum]|uniref:DUF8039 domain-containing protein n=1 Tax=Papaver atlanticum TaxID=357466 RepID=A0AAD4S9L3_9MAGN|nr:hypothetical protein MKW98_027907 [Papaver atlanticum]
MIKKLHRISSSSYLGNLSEFDCGFLKGYEYFLLILWVLLFMVLLWLVNSLMRCYVQLSQLKPKKAKANNMFGLISDMSTHKNSSWEPEHDDDEYADNETATLEALALQNGEEDEGEDSDDGSSSSDCSVSISDDESSESSEYLDTGDPKNKIESKENNVRGLTRLKKLIFFWNGQICVIEFDKLGHFKWKYKFEISNYMGVIVRRDVGLRHLNWKKVKTELRDKLWEELVRFYEIEETRRNRIMKYFGEHLRNFRRKLYSGGYLLNARGVEASEHHKYDHRLGRAGYAGLLEKLIKEKEIREDENPSRSLLWRKAHQNKNGEYDDDGVREKEAQLEEFDKQLEDGTLTKKPGTDSITLVFGEEHGGRNLPRKGASKEQIELKKQLDDERRVNQMEREKNQMERERKDKEMKEEMNAQAKMMNNLMSRLKSQGVLKKKKSNSKKARKSPIREKSLMPEAERQESNSNSQSHESQHASQSTASKDKSELQMTGKYKQTSLASEHQSLNSQDESQSKDQTELSTIGKCKLASATLRNIIALGTTLPSTPNQLVHGDPLKDDCVKVSVDKAIFPNHSLPIQSAHLKTARDAEKSFVAWPKEFVISCSTNQPLSDPDEHDADQKTKKTKNKKKPSDTKSGELKSRRSSKRLKNAA